MSGCPLRRPKPSLRPISGSIMKRICMYNRLVVFFFCRDRIQARTNLFLIFLNSVLSVPDLVREGLVFSVHKIDSKKQSAQVAQFSLPLMDLQLRHALPANAKPESFTDPSSGIQLSFKVHLSSLAMMRNQLLTEEDTERLAAMEDLAELAKKGDGQLHSYLMDEPLLHVLLEVTQRWLHDALCPVDIAAAVPAMWKAIINSPLQQCVQYFSLTDGSDSDFFEYFVTAMLAPNSLPKNVPAPSSSPTQSPSFPAPRGASPGPSASSTLFFNRERKIQMIGLFAMFLKKSIPTSFRSSLVTQMCKMVVAVTKYISASVQKGTAPKAEHEAFLLEVLSPSIFVAGNLTKIQHSVILPPFVQLLTAHEKISMKLLIRVLVVIGELPKAPSNAIYTETNLIAALDDLAEHPEPKVQKLASYNWSKCMLTLTGGKGSAVQQIGLEMSESQGVSASSS